MREVGSGHEEEVSTDDVDHDILDMTRCHVKLVMECVLFDQTYLYQSLKVGVSLAATVCHV